MKSRFMAKLQAALIIGLLACSYGAFAAKGAPGGGGGGGKAPLVFPTTNSISVGSEIPLGALSVSATSGNAQPTITLVATSYPEVTVANITNIPSGKVGPLSTTILQLTPWTPTRAEIGTGSIVFTASDGVTSITYTLNITVLDAPEAVSGLSAASDGTQITASWQPSAVGGTGPISYTVQACYRVFIRTNVLVAQCNTIGTFADTTVTFPAHTSDPTNNPPGTYVEILVSPVDSVGVGGPGTLFLMP